MRDTSNHPHMSGSAKIKKGKIRARVRFRYDYERLARAGVVKKRYKLIQLNIIKDVGLESGCCEVKRQVLAA